MDTVVPIDNMTDTGSLCYKGLPPFPKTTNTAMPPKNATPVALSFQNALWSLNSKQLPGKVPLDIDHSQFFTIGVGVNPCSTCVNGTTTVAAIDNVTFELAACESISEFSALVVFWTTPQ